MNKQKRTYTDNELDQLFRDAHFYEAQEPFYNPDLWLEMEALLPPATTKPIVSPYFIIVNACIAALFFIFPFSTPHWSTMKSKPNDQLKTKQIASASPISKDAKQITERQVATQTFGKSNIQPQEQNSASNSTQLALENVDVKSNSLLSPIEVALAPKTIDFPQNNFKIDDLTMKSEQKVHWYLELGTTLGSSPYLNAQAERNLVAGAFLGAGITKKMEQWRFHFGLNLRLEGFGGLKYEETNFSPNIRREVSVNQLFSIDFPFQFGYQWKKSEYGISFVPGTQLFINGKERVFENNLLTREKNYIGKVEHSSTLSMEIGVNYYYHFNQSWSLGLRLQADVLRPFHTDYYLGKTASVPLNGQLTVRKNF